MYIGDPDFQLQVPSFFVDFLPLALPSALHLFFQSAKSPPECKRKMADQDPIQPQQQQQQQSHIQFGDEIQPVKSNGAPSYTAVLRDSKVSQRVTSHDLEEKAVQLANEDLNTKKKQVRCATPLERCSPTNWTQRHTGVGCYYG